MTDNLSELLDTPTYHQRLRRRVQKNEPELWEWFRRSSQPTESEIQAAELQLLQTSYRLDGGTHSQLVGYASILAGRLDLTGDIVLYQELQDGSRNARVQQLGDTVHIVFRGDLLNLLDGDELEAVLAHEMAHVALWSRDDRSYWVLDHLIHRVEEEPLADDALRETARRLRLHTEVWADAVASHITKNQLATIAAIVKVNSGLRNVDANAYLRQAQQILEADPTSSSGWTHPELHVRVACLAALDTRDPDPIVAALIEGPDDLDRLDLFAQDRLSELTARVLAAGRMVATKDEPGVPPIDLGPIDRYLQDYLELDIHQARPLLDDEVAGAEPSVRHLCAALLVDIALVGDATNTHTRRLISFAKEAERIGIAKEFDKVLGRAVKKTVAEIRRMRKASV